MQIKFSAKKFIFFCFINNRGQALVELLVTLSLASVLLPGLLTGFIASREGKAQQIQRLEATALLREAEEAVRIARENWANIATNGTYHPVISNNSWSLASGNESINGYTRAVVISDVRRDSSGNIIASGGTIDLSTKKIVSTVSWNTPLSSSVTSTLYLARYRNNSSFIQTTKADFDAGSNSNTVVTNSAGGEVTLGAGGGGSWCAPNLSITALDLPKNGVANAVAAIEGQAFAGTGDNASGISYANVTISNTNPPIATVAGTFDGYKTNAGIFGQSDYAYLATDTNAKEVVIVNLTNPVNGKYSESGYFDAPGNGNATGVYVSGTIGFMTDGAGHLYTFDLSSKSGSRPLLGSVTLSGIGNRLYVSGSYAYVAESGTTQLEIIQASSDGKTLTKVGQAQVNGLDGRDVFINTNSTRAYLVTAASSTQKEFFIIDISTKTGARPTLGSYESNGMNPKGVTAVPGNNVIIVGIGGEEYQVIDVSNESTPVRCGGLNINSGVNGVSSVLEQDGDAYSYIITGDATSEFKLIAGGPGGQYSNSGTFISNYYDAQTTVAYNRIIPNFILPSQTTLQFQVAVAAAVSGSCNGANYYFVGPDGTSNSYYTQAGAIPTQNNGLGYVNPGQCIKYKAIFSTSDPTAAPIVTDVSVNFSP